MYVNEVGLAPPWRERGWGEGSNQWKNRNFGSSITLLTPSPTLPRSAGEGIQMANTP